MNNDKSYNRAQRAYDNMSPYDGQDEWEVCPVCEGAGNVDIGGSAIDEDNYESCPTCDGEGKINISQRKRDARDAALEDREDERIEHNLYEPRNRYDDNEI